VKKLIPSDRLEWYVSKNYDEWFSYYSFKPEDVMSYYDIYSNGAIYIYIKRTVGFWIFKKTKIYRESFDDIFYDEIPERRICNGREN